MRRHLTYTFQQVEGVLRGGIALKSLATEATYRRSAGQRSLVWAGGKRFSWRITRSGSATTLGRHQHIYRYLYNEYI
jgi:hypothetical protein